MHPGAVRERLWRHTEPFAFSADSGTESLEVRLAHCVQVVAMMLPMGADPIGMGGSALAVYLAITGLAALIDREKLPT